MQDLILFVSLGNTRFQLYFIKLLLRIELPQKYHLPFAQAELIHSFFYSVKILQSWTVKKISFHTHSVEVC